MIEKKYINADEAFEIITDFASRADTKSAYNAFWKSAKVLKTLSTADITEVKHGYWIEDDYYTREWDGDYAINRAFACSLCENRVNGRKKLIIVLIVGQRWMVKKMAEKKYIIDSVISNDLKRAINSFKRMERGGIGLSNYTIKQICESALVYITTLENKLKEEENKENYNGN